MENFRCLIPMEPMSVWKYHRQRGKIRFISREGKEYRDVITLCLKHAHIDEFKATIDDVDMFELRLHFGIKFFNNNGSVKRKDVDNFLKPIIDILFDALELDDCLVKKIVAEKDHGKFIDINLIKIN